LRFFLHLKKSLNLKCTNHFRIAFVICSASDDTTLTVLSTQDVFHAWKLRDLKIYGIDGDFYSDEVRAVAGAVPALARTMGQNVIAAA
jgi:hypothetical protein